MKKLFLSAMLLASCTPHPKEVPDKQWLLNSVKSLPLQDGWKFTSNGGGGSSGDGTVYAEISLNGKAAGQAMSELHSLIVARLKGAGYKIVGSGHASSGAGLTGFSLSVRTPDSVGNMVFSSAPIDSSKLVLAIAIAQQRKSH